MHDVEDAGHDELEGEVEAHGFEEGGGVVDEGVDSGGGSWLVDIRFERGDGEGGTCPTNCWKNYERQKVSKCLKH